MRKGVIDFLIASVMVYWFLRELSWMVYIFLNWALEVGWLGVSSLGSSGIELGILEARYFEGTKKVSDFS